MFKKTSFQTLISTFVGLSAAVLGASALTSCGSTTPDTGSKCVSADGLWEFPTCTAADYVYVGVAGAPCTTPDGLWIRSNCADPSTGAYQAECATNDPNWKLANCSDPNSAVWIGAGPAPAGVAPPVTGVNPPVAAPPPGTPTPTGTGPAAVPGTSTTPTGVTPPGTVTPPGVDPTATPTAVTPPGVTPTGTDPVPPGTDPVPPGTDPVPPGTTAPTDTGTTPPPASGADPAGYYRSGDLHGCTFTSTGSVGVTTIQPQDFVSKAASDSYCIAGSVGTDPDYASVAILGFNIAQEPGGADCGYDPTNTEVPPSLTPTSTGLAISYDQSTASILRVQIQGPTGHLPGDEGAPDRWCYEFPTTSGPAFVKWSDFTLTCWDPDAPGASYTPDKPLVAVGFTVPGDADVARDFDFCVHGFALGDSVADAPAGGGGGGPLVGTLVTNFQRARVTVDGENYVIQNNAWGADGQGVQNAQTINFSDNSFEVTSLSGSKGGNGEPISFPSIFIGSNGDNINTSATDNLPIQVSAIQSIPTVFDWYGPDGGDYNATYDVWFQPAGAKPAGNHETANGAFLMVWLYDPPQSGPIGSFGESGARTYTNVNVGGTNWNVYIGPRGGGGSDSQAPVINYVAPSRTNRLSFNLADFIKHARDNNYGITNDMWLSDVFAGFEIWGWNGSPIGVKEFTAVVNP